MIIIYTISILAAIFMQAFFSCSETALTSVSQAKLKDLVSSDNRRAKPLDDFLKEKGAYLGTTLMGTNIAVVSASVMATRIFSEYFPPATLPLFTTAIMVPITLIFAEIIPKMVARQFALSISLGVVAPLRKFFRIFYPIIVIINSLASILISPFRRSKISWDRTFTKGDIKQMLLVGHETGEVEADEVELIHKVLEFGSTIVKDIMVPLYRVSSIEIKDSIEDLKSLISLTGFSRIPVYAEDKKNIVGIVNIYDILFNERDEGPVVEGYMREAVTVKSTDSLDIVLTRLRHNKQPMGVVVNERDQVCGIVTIEDVLEEIVGEIEDKA